MLGWNQSLYGLKLFSEIFVLLRSCLMFLSIDSCFKIFFWLGGGGDVGRGRFFGSAIVLTIRTPFCIFFFCMK